jgi:P4 family phage/plasmid primase-like protien
MSWGGTIDLFAEKGYQLIPLVGKRPVDKHWTTRDYNRKELLLHTFLGRLNNLGVRMGPKDLVIDVDPRNGGAESLIRLKSDLSIALDDCPAVKTGGDGWHYYYRLPQKDIQLPGELSEYAGVEWKTKGRQVVAPGSIHPDTGRLYKWHHKLDIVPAAPNTLLDFLQEHLQLPKVNADAIAAISNQDLEDILAQLPVEEYGTNETWFKLMAAAYHATEGAGRDEFIAWSTADPAYREHDRIIALRWKSLERATATKRSLGTLIYELLRHNGKVPARLRRSHAQELTKFDPEAASDLVNSTIETLTPDSKAKEIKEILEQVAQMEPLEQADCLVEIQEKTRRTKTELNEALRHARKQAKAAPEDSKMVDVPYDVAHEVLESYFKGDTLTRALDGRYWRYTGTHWEPYSTDELKGLIKTKCEEYRVLNPAVKFHVSQTILAAEVVLKAAVSKGADLLGSKKDPEPVVNCSNCEIWLQEDGTFQRKFHKPESRLTYCLPLEYSEKASCELLDETIDGIFGFLPDKDEVIRHLWEVFGYALQPKKSIPAWFLFQGWGANGKSLLLDVLIALLGPASRPVASISELTSSRSEFALSECVGALAIIDDDVKRDTVLNDDILKKLSEDKMIRARFLHQNPFSFRNCATIFLAANNWPQTRDLSDGMMRRAYGFPFRQQFKHDDKRKKKILDNELPGALNRALEGLLRLRRRGHFDVPKSCKDLIETWKTKSNQILSYLEECHKGGKDENLTFELLWEGYQHWANENQVRRTYSKYSFREALNSCGIKTKGK